jgi:hypothetical protein
LFPGGKKMPRKKLGQNNLSKIFDKKISLEDIPIKTIKMTIFALRWVFLLIFLFITIGIIALFLTGGENYIQIILGYSIAGFFTFFMGYFGWVLAQGMIEMITGKEDSSIHGSSYYIKKHKKIKF